MKHLLAAIALAIWFGGFADVSAAHAAPDTGTYDDRMNLQQESCWSSVHIPVARVVGDPGSAVCAHSRNWINTAIPRPTRIGSPVARR